MNWDPNDPFGQVRGPRKLLLYIRAYALALWRTGWPCAYKLGLIAVLYVRLCFRRLGAFSRPLRRFLKPALAVLAVCLALCAAYQTGLGAQPARALAPAGERTAPEQPSEPENPVLTLFFDDRWAVPPGSEVQTLGDNIPAHPGDGAVLSLHKGVLTAVGTGETVITLDGSPLTVRVEPAPISLLLLLGQSNMEGNEGDRARSVACPEGQVYSTYGPSSVKLAGLVGGDRRIPLLSADTAEDLVPAALTGERSAVSRLGSRLRYPVDALIAGGGGKGGPDSGIAYAWHQQTGEKVWVVNAANSGSDIASWQPGEDNFREAVALCAAAQATLRGEVAAGHYTVAHMGYFWLQGCADKDLPAAAYKAAFLRMHRGLQEALDGDLAALEFAAILMVQAADGADSFTTWRELTMNGPRQAQYELGASLSADCCDIFVASTVMEGWVYDENGRNDGVRAYFEEKYGQYLTYPLQNRTKSWAIPETPEDVKDTIHYNQVGYNEIGLDAAENMARVLRLLGE